MKMTMTRAELDSPILLPHNPRYGDELTLTVHALDDRGAGLARLDALVGPQRQPKRFVVTIRDALPGEEVRVRAERTRKREISATLQEILTPSPARISPRCPHFGPRHLPDKGCGGCTLQHLPYEAQLQAKHDLVRQALDGVPGIDALLRPILACDNPFTYRNKMEFSVGDDADHPFTIGLHPAGYKYDVLDLRSCDLFSPWVEAMLPTFSRWCAEHGLQRYDHRRNTGFLRQLTLREGKRTGERMAELVTSSGETARFEGEERPVEEVIPHLSGALQQISAEAGFPIHTLYWTQHHIKKGEPTRLIEHLLHGPGTLAEELHVASQPPLRFQIHPRAFFQPNTLQAELLYGEVLRAVGLLDGGEATPQRVLDLYCGTGTIALCMARHAQRVMGIELSGEAVENAKKNATDNGIDNVDFFAGDVKDVLTQAPFIEAREQGVDVVVVDPPRAGLFPQAMTHIQAIDAPRLVYVSCNPKSLGRDLKLLMEEGGYRVRYVQPVDMFPQTLHVENVALLER